MITQDNISITQRLAAPKPKIFKTLQNLGMILTAGGGAVLLAPVAPIVATVAGYVLAAGSVATAVSSLPVDFDKLNAQQENK